MLFFSSQTPKNHYAAVELNHSAHLSLDVHCSSKLKKKKFIILLSPLSLKYSFPFLSLSPTFLLSSFFLNFFFLSSSPASLISLIPQLAGQLPHHRPVPPTQLADPRQAPSPISPSPIAQSVPHRRPQRQRPKPQAADPCLQPTPSPSPPIKPTPPSPPHSVDPRLRPVL